MRTRMKCPKHQVELVCPGCVGARGRAANTEAQAEAARINGRKGGRPPATRSVVRKFQKKK